MIDNHVQLKESWDTLAMLKNTRTEFEQKSPGAASEPSKLRLNTIIDEIECDIETFDSECDNWWAGD